jgi:hypothetical protein
MMTIHWRRTALYAVGGAGLGMVIRWALRDPLPGSDLDFAIPLSIAAGGIFVGLFGWRAAFRWFNEE